MKCHLWKIFTWSNEAIPSPEIVLLLFPLHSFFLCTIPNECPEAGRPTCAACCGFWQRGYLEALCKKRGKELPVCIWYTKTPWLVLRLCWNLKLINSVFAKFSFLLVIYLCNRMELCIFFSSFFFKWRMVVIIENEFLRWCFEK